MGIKEGVFVLVGGCLLAFGIESSAKYLDRRGTITAVCERTGHPREKIKELVDEGIDVSISKMIDKNVDGELLRILKEDTEFREYSEKERAIYSGLSIEGALHECVSSEFFEGNKYREWHSKGKGVRTMIACRDYISLEEAVQIPYDIDESDVEFLQKEHKLPSEYAVPLMIKGIKPKDIAEKYSQELCGISAEERAGYLKYFRDRDIKAFVKAKLSLNLVNQLLDQTETERLAEKNPSLRNILKIAKVTPSKLIYLVASDKLDALVFSRWYSAGLLLGGISPVETIFGIEHGYAPETAAKAHRLGSTLFEVHRQRELNKLISEEYK